MAEETKLAEIDNAMAGEPTEEDIPYIAEEPGLITLTFNKMSDYHVIVDITNITDKGEAELTFWGYYVPDGHKAIIYSPSIVNLHTPAGKAGLIRQLEHRGGNADFANWHWVVNCIAWAVVKRSRHDEPAKELFPSPDISLEPEYLLRPILYKNHPGVIFGDKGSMKSMMALVIAFIAQLPLADNKLGLTPAPESNPCLFLDYEDNEQTFLGRWTAIQNGFGIKAQMPIYYMHMEAPLAEMIYPVKVEVAKYKAKLLIVDSLGMAAKGNLNDPEPAIEYNKALRAIGITSLSTAHNSKDLTTKIRSIFGSVYFTNMARTIWEAKAESQSNIEVVMSLKHTNANLSEKHGTLGFRFTFDNTNSLITVAKTDLRDTGLSNEIPLTIRMDNEVRTGAKSNKELAELLDASEDSIRVIANRKYKKGKYIKVGDKWGLKDLNTA